VKNEIHPKAINKNYLILVSIIVTGLVVIFLIPPEFLFSKHSICIHYRILGVQCPFCGTTRAIYSFMHLNFGSAWKFNFNVFPLALLLPIFILRIVNSALLTLRLEKFILLLLAAGYIIIYILRLAASIN